MPFDVARTFAERTGENYALHERYMNHQLARTLRTLGAPDRAGTLRRPPALGSIGKRRRGRERHRGQQSGGGRQECA